MGAKHHDFYDSEGTLLKSFTGSCSSNREVGSLQEVCGFCLILIVLPLPKPLPYEFLQLWVAGKYPAALHATAHQGAVSVADQPAYPSLCGIRI